MLKSFIEFIFESESSGVTRIYYSNKFRDFLSLIERTSKDIDVTRLATALRHCENLDSMSLDVTLIDLTNQNDMISYIQVNRIRRKYQSLDGDGRGGFDNFDEWLSFIATQDEKNALWTQQRGQVKIGKFVKKVFKDNGHNVVDSVVEKFGNFFKATYDFGHNLEDRMQLITGEDIRKWYLENNYSERRGQLANSCMRYNSCQKYLDIYVENPEVCSLLIMYSDAAKVKICGRAIVWKCTDGNYIMDRIYTHNDYDIESFRKYSDSKGWLRIDKDWKSKVVQLKKDVIYDYYPYMDNFCYFNHEKFFLTNDESSWPGEGFYKLQNTDGSYTADEGVWSAYHHDYLNRDEAVYCRNVDDWVLTDSAIWLEYLDIWASPAEETAYSEWADGSYYLEDLTWSEIMNGYIPSGDTISIYTNYQGDEDYIPSDFSKDILIDIEYDGEMVKTISKFVVLDPTTLKYHFLDEKIDDVPIKQVIENKLQDTLVDKEKIKNYLLTNDFNLNIKKLKNIQFLSDSQACFYKIWIPFNLFDNLPTRNLIKYLLWAYPEKSLQRDGLPKLTGPLYDKSENYRRFKNSIINFDPEFAKELLGDKIDILEKGGNDTIYQLTKLSHSFIGDVFSDPEIYKMWYKWKMC